MASPWPWMAGHPAAIPDPIPPISADDDRPSVKDLIRENRALIDDLKKELQDDPLFDANKHDDLWLLRFLLSHKKKMKPATKAARYTLGFRKKFEFDEKDIRAHPPSEKDCPHPVVRKFLQYCHEDTFRYGMEHPRGPLIGFIQIRGYNQHEMVAHLDESQWLPCFSYVTEWAFQWLDYTTRTTGRLTKTTRVVDAAGATFAMMNFENSRREGKAMNTMEDCYPQLLESIIVVNPPLWVYAAWKLLKPIMPKRVTQKLDFFVPDKKKQSEANNDAGNEDDTGTSIDNEEEEKDEKKKKQKKSKKQTNPLFRYLSAKELPVHLGGENEGWPTTPMSYL